MQERASFSPLRVAWAIPALALLTIALGTWAWIDHHVPADEALYRSVALFEINNDAYTHGEALADWRFRIARWTGAGVIFSGLLALAALLQEHLARALARWKKQAVAVVGGGDLAGAAFEVASHAGKSALWLGAPIFSASSFTSIALAWPPTDRSRAVVDHCRRAEHVLIVGVEDAAALAFARAARRASRDAQITVLMRDAVLAEDAASALNDARTRVASAATVSARALVTAHPPFLTAREFGHARIHAFIVGFGQTGQAIARELIVNCRTAYLELPRVTVVDPQAKALEGVLRVRAPELDACIESCFIEGEISGRAMRPDPDHIAQAVAQAGPITCAYVCLADDTSGLSAAAMLQRLLRAVGVPMPPTFVRLRDASAMSAADDQGGRASPTAFGDLGSILRASEFMAGAPDAAARDVHEAYRAALTPERRDDPSNRSAYPWDRLDETRRQNNRDVVAHIPAKFASAGIDPARWRGGVGLPRLGPGERLFHDASQLEVLAELEHERFLAQRRMDGWRRTDLASQDESGRLHPTLVAYDALSEDVKELDRAIVRQTQAACGGPA
jgi:hypothetical protein